MNMLYIIIPNQASKNPLKIWEGKSPLGISAYNSWGITNKHCLIWRSPNPEKVTIRFRLHKTDIRWLWCATRTLKIIYSLWIEEEEAPDTTHPLENCKNRSAQRLHLRKPPVYLSKHKARQWFSPPYLYKILQVVGADAREVHQEVSAGVLQLHVLAFLSRSLQGAEHHGSQHQVQKHPGEDGEQGGAAHGDTSTDSKRRLLLLFASLGAGVARITAPAAENISNHTDTRGAGSSLTISCTWGTKWIQASPHCRHTVSATSLIKPPDIRTETIARVAIKQKRSTSWTELTCESVLSSSSPSSPRAGGFCPWIRSHWGARPPHTLKEGTLDRTRHTHTHFHTLFTIQCTHVNKTRTTSTLPPPPKTQKLSAVRMSLDESVYNDASV